MPSDVYTLINASGVIRYGSIIGGPNKPLETDEAINDRRSYTITDAEASGIYYKLNNRFILLPSG